MASQTTLSAGFTGADGRYWLTFQLLGIRIAIGSQTLRDKCVDAFDSRVLRCPVGPSLAGLAARKRSPKRVHFVVHVTFGTNVRCNMLYPGGRGSRWHMGCNYLLTRTTTSLDFKKKKTRV